MPSDNNSELLYRLDEKVSEVLRRMGEQDAAIANIQTRNEVTKQNLESRIKALENFRIWLLGVSAAVGFMFGIIKDWLTNKIL